LPPEMRGVEHIALKPGGASPRGGRHFLPPEMRGVRRRPKTTEGIHAGDRIRRYNLDPAYSGALTTPPSPPRCPPNGGQSNPRPAGRARRHAPAVDAGADRRAEKAQASRAPRSQYRRQPGGAVPVWNAAWTLKTNCPHTCSVALAVSFRPWNWRFRRPAHDGRKSRVIP
jgi:hypothetical protein